MQRKRPPFHEYYMQIAMAVRARANCTGLKVGAILVVGKHIVATGYNGTPEGFENCEEGGCYRCTHRDEFGPGEAYDKCVCVHAEQNCLLMSARFGIAVQGGAVYSTERPCFSCAKELFQAGVRRVYYLHEWGPKDQGLKDEYTKLMGKFDLVELVKVDDPDADWAHPGPSPKKT
ncbi:MAG: deoxycytidylate deaminase [Planctomycetota bacterium]|jgi:dCMP deaminase